MEAAIVYWWYIGIMDEKMEATTSIPLPKSRWLLGQWQNARMHMELIRAIQVPRLA